MNPISQLFKNKKERILNIYFTAGYPNLDDTTDIILSLQKAGVDLIEVGIPYSDPLADGTTIQDSSQTALHNGISLQLALDQIESIKDQVTVPLIVMGYYNQFLQFGMEQFVQRLVACGISGVIIPDLPMDYYESHYKELFQSNNIAVNFLITPETSPLRIQKVDQLSEGFIYMVSRSSITGAASDISDEQKQYFERISNMHLNTPRLIGFGIHDKTSFDMACQYVQGAIIGSAFIRYLKEYGVEGIGEFVDRIFDN